MTREFIEKVFSQIPKHVPVCVLGGLGLARICVSLDSVRAEPKDGSASQFVCHNWVSISYDNQLVLDWKDIVAEAERLSLKADEEMKQMQKG